MVNRADPGLQGGEIGFFKMLEGLPPSLLSQLGSLLGQLGQKEGMDPLELSKLVLKMLAEQKTDQKDDVRKILNIVRLLPMKSPEAMQFLAKLETKLDESLKREQKVEKEVAPKSEVVADTKGTTKAERPERGDNFIRPQMGPKQEPAKPIFGTEVVLKQVAVARHLLVLPEPVKNQVEGRENAGAKTSIPEPKKGADSELNSNNAHRVGTPKEEPKSPTKSDLHSNLNTLKEGQSLEKKIVERQAPSALSHSAPKRLAERGFFGAPQGTEPKTTAAHSQPQVMPQGAEKTSIPCVPYASSMQAESRRKEKREKRRSLFDDEEEDESPEKKYPREDL